MTGVRRTLAWSGALIGVVAGAAVAVLAQREQEATVPGSLGALTAEVRQLRLAVEESMRSQTQTQALGVYLSVQQSRLLQMPLEWTRRGKTSTV